MGSCCTKASANKSTVTDHVTVAPGTEFPVVENPASTTVAETSQGSLPTTTAAQKSQHGTPRPPVDNDREAEQKPTLQAPVLQDYDEAFSAHATDSEDEYWEEVD